MMSTDADQPASVTMTSVVTDEKDDVRLTVTSVDSVSVVTHSWTARPAPAAAATHHDCNNKEHHDCIEKLSVDELRGIYQHGNTQRPLCATAPPPPPPLYGRLASIDLDAGYDYNYSPQYASRYSTFQAPPTSSYVAAVTPYAAPYSPAEFSAYTFNFAGPCAGTPAYNPPYVPHHLPPPSAALLSSERSAPSYRFPASSTSLLQSRTLSFYQTLDLLS